MTATDEMREAARREAALVYGRTCPEAPRATTPAPRRQPKVLSTAQVRQMRADGKSIAEIAIRLGQSRNLIADLVHRLEKAS